MTRTTDFSWNAFCEHFGIRLERDAAQLEEFTELTGIDREYARTLRKRNGVPATWWLRTQKRVRGGVKSGQNVPPDDRDVYVYEVSAANRWRAKDFAALDEEQLRALFPQGIGLPLDPRLASAEPPREGTDPDQRGSPGEQSRTRAK